MDESVVSSPQRGSAKTARIPIKVEALAQLPKPEWIRVRISQSENFREVKRVLREASLHTVCEEASCPNIGECFGKGTATFMVLGDLCTRRCPFCDVARTARMQAAKCPAPPSRRSSRSTLVITTYWRPSSATVSARWRASCGSGGCGRPWATSQKGQRRVHRSPSTMKVAVPLPKHSPMFGHEASSQTVCRRASRSTCLTSRKRSPCETRTRIQAGFAKAGAASTVIGMRAVFRLPRCGPLTTDGSMAISRSTWRRRARRWSHRRPRAPSC